MTLTEKRNETLELSQDMLKDVNGGCWLGGRFGDHHGFILQGRNLPTGSFNKFKCDDCGKIFYTFKDANTGKSIEITKALFDTVWNMD